MAPLSDSLSAVFSASDTLLPDIQVTNYARDDDRSLTVRHNVYRGRPLSESADEVAKHLARLWGFPLRFETLSEDGTLRHQDFRTQ